LSSPAARSRCKSIRNVLSMLNRSATGPRAVYRHAALRRVVREHHHSPPVTRKEHREGLPPWGLRCASAHALSPERTIPRANVERPEDVHMPRDLSISSW
jgi:hypothetical protein